MKDFTAQIVTEKILV